MKKFKFTIQGHDYDVDIKKIEGNVADVEVNGSVYSVLIHKELQTTKTPTLIRSNVAPPKENKPLQRTSGLCIIKAPLPGVILSFAIKEGDQVVKGQKLLVMEAMKMENNILAETDGAVKSIMVKTGQNVMQGDVLMEIQ
ncbi:MAG TPA: acetyl-CoA carboxylase biotin carboxyl carrier protein subunit [Bacteroidales bacterium]|nr:MAG: acetyl-CoA carboxylase biotin carboxyl carrier protein subunit [Bacteroidetes bacterium GWF2_33_38]OFY75597.1 MAG: acetyl-CoA carboxylase biotin carboxyl carrier protein subunit [Bacteroidetes bacterium RIFOXYA12_FULL_33_9]OFY85992.1 MAG: acetyl-CoA carboxylase biotin carboxyl carrier protein subunit [Bacteroidetes bacterium RIFOXYA2_FULL_33_7]HBF88943.1 acetyl-CoA carboxylase biotin carboxyl carrier protein subunit [Bacteroidales bacterium]